MPPAIFVGLLLVLWTWKCFWIVVMQDKLLYLTWLPPFSRSEKIADYQAECKPVQWEEKQIRSLDGTKLTVCEGHIPGHGPSTTDRRKRSVVICYFQGNGGSTPLRLPLLSQALRSIAATSASLYPDDNVSYTVVALSYRGYWTSSGRATQSGIELDAQAFLNWVSQEYAAPETDLQIILWGHSLGSAVTTTAIATYLPRQELERPSYHTAGGPLVRPGSIAGLVLEAPTSSIKDMLISLYPQKWLPYRYLWPLSWNNWNNTTALERMACWRDSSTEPSADGLKGLERQTSNPSSARSIPPIFLLSAEKDEVIPPHVADDLEKDSHRLGLDIERMNVVGAMHTEAPQKVAGRQALVSFILRNTNGRSQ